MHENKTCCRDALANRRGYDVRLLGVIDKQGNSRLVGCSLSLKVALYCYMAALSTLVDPDDIQELVRTGYTHREIASIVKNANPGARGVSERSVRRFCTSYDIHYSQRMNQADLRLVVASAVREVYIYTLFLICKL